MPVFVVVCCSAGVGRTGTFIMMDILLQHITEHDYIDVFGTVLNLRDCRCNMVQTEVRTLLLSKLILTTCFWRISIKYINPW